MSNNSGQIFQLSLTEIAFILVFILMFLLGSMVFLAHKENQDLKETLKSLKNFEQKKVDFDNATKLLEETLAGKGISNPEEVIKNLVDTVNATKLLEDTLVGKGISNPEEVIKNLIDTVNAQEEIAKLKKLIVDQDAKITALSEIQKAIDSTKGLGDGALVAGVEKLEKSFKDDPLLAALSGETPAQKIESLVEEYREFDALKRDGSNPILVKKENSDLKGQIQFLKNRLEANGGMDFPPCWADANGKVQMLLTVELHENELNVSRAWPDSREADAKALPNISAVMAAQTAAYPSFLKAVKPISDLSRQLNCRHYVRIKNMIPDAVTSDRRRLSIEDYFYKVEVRR